MKEDMILFVFEYVPFNIDCFGDTKIKAGKIGYLRQNIVLNTIFEHINTGNTSNPHFFISSVLLDKDDTQKSKFMTQYLKSRTSSLLTTFKSLDECNKTYKKENYTVVILYITLDNNIKAYYNVGYENEYILPPFINKFNVEFEYDNGNIFDYEKDLYNLVGIESGHNFNILEEFL
jgi:hypothetical protein